MEIIVALYFAFFGATVSYNATVCLDGPRTAAEEQYCEDLASNDMDANDFITFGSPIGAVFDGGM